MYIERFGAPWALAAVTMLAGCYRGADPDSGLSGGGLFDPGAEGGADGDDDDDANGDDDDDDDSAGVATEPGAERAQLRRLTRSQYGDTLVDLLGTPLTIPDAIEPDLVLDHFANVGAAQGAMSMLGTEQFESAAEDVVDEVFASTTRRDTLVGCDPAAPGCFATFAGEFGRRAFRRPLADEEVERYALLGDEVSELRGDPWEGARAILAAILASPSFLYMVEVGEPEPGIEGRWRFTSVEMASRLAYAIWNGPPDEVLLAAAESGSLTDPAEIRAQAERMLADPKAGRAVRRFMAEWLGIDVVANLDKDLGTFPNASPELYAAMYGEALRLAEHAALSEDGSLLDLIDGDYTFVDAQLAAFYGVSAPTETDAEGFGMVSTAGTNGERRGILGTAGVLAAQSRRTRTAPTIRGMYVQSRLRCQDLPPPPPEVPMDIPDGTDDDPQDKSIRELLEEHRENPVCAACHDTLDPPGLAMEHFDALGAYRTVDAGFPVDDATEIEGSAIEGMPGLAGFLRDDESVRRCMVRQLFRFTTGHREVVEEADAIEALAGVLDESEYKLTEFLPELLASTSFRALAPPT